MAEDEKIEETEKTVTCCQCEHDDILESESKEFDGDIYCLECYDEHISTCNHCGKDYLSDDMHTAEDNIYCERCFDNIFTTCEDCSEVIRIDDSYSVRNITLCESCFNDNYFYCESCNELYHNDDYGRDGMCQDCANDRDNAFIYNYDYKPEPVFNTINGNTDNGFYLGFELEVDKGSDKTECSEEINKAIPKDTLYLKTDGSLGDEGFELVSHPATLEYYQSKFNFEKVLAILQKYHYRSHDTSTCGLHVHISSDDISQLERVKIGMLIHTNEREFSIFARRSANNYSKFKQKAIPKAYGKCEERYEAVNFMNRHTIEFRLFKGTLRLNTILATIELCHAVRHFIKKCSSRKIASDGYNLLVKYILKNEGMYKNLIAYLEEKNILRKGDIN